MCSAWATQLMKTLFTLMASLLGLVSFAVAQPALQPVENTVHFTGEFIDADQAEPKPELRRPLKVDYPQKMRDRAVKGWAQVAFIVNTSGRVEDVQVVKANDTSFADAAIEAIKTSRWKAGKKDGKPVRVLMVIPVHFEVQP